MAKAHYDRDTKKHQDLDVHLKNVAQLGREAAEVINQGDVLFLLGLYHDLGKADRAFQVGKLGSKPHLQVDHSYAGARYLFKKILLVLEHMKIDVRERLAFSEIICYVISAHHGMYDLPLTNEETVDKETYNFSKLKQRMDAPKGTYHYKEDVEPFAKSLDGIIKSEGYGNLQRLIYQAYQNFEKAFRKLPIADESERDYYLSCFVRLYLSFLKNADILDTINAYDLVINPMSQKSKNNLARDYCQSIECFYKELSHPETQMNKIRMQLAERIKKRGQNDSEGIYRLDLPTGSGKTNLSMRYAFHQMTCQKKERFFYLAPYLSVLEQNARQIQKMIGDEGVLEHHSNIVEKLDQNGYPLEAETDDNRKTIESAYLKDTWDNSVVLSTTVQFFQTLFKTQSSSIRRFANLSNSVIVLDEVHALPIEVTTLFNLSMNFLNRVMGASVILCTATQPIYDSDKVVHRLLYSSEKSENTDLVALGDDEREIFRRTKLIKYNGSNAQTNLEDVTDFILSHVESTLIILNTKRAVEKLFSLLIYKTDRLCFHLSTAMCAQHRLDIIEKIQHYLEGDAPIICVSTQLVEAGVDLDFKRVVRSYVGIDSIVQAAGRCNREAKLDFGEVTLINLSQEEENLKYLPSIKVKKDKTEIILSRHMSPINPTSLNNEFFERYYADVTQQAKMDYPIGDCKTIYDLLSSNVFYASKMKRALRQSFKMAGNQMDLIKDEGVGILVPYKEGETKIAILEDLLNMETYLTPESLVQIKKFCIVSNLIP